MNKHVGDGCISGNEYIYSSHCTLGDRHYAAERTRHPFGFVDQLVNAIVPEMNRDKNIPVVSAKSTEILYHVG
ncbi:MAG: hypothetical protein EBE86_018725 [Hormoscilla sp. GUM202]|nr:hypothetical protein [Hormoscilla sp. GUM202]